MEGEGGEAGGRVVGEFWSHYFHFSVPFCESDSMLQQNFENDKLLRFDEIDLSKES